MIFSFQVEEVDQKEALSKCAFLEVPIKVESKGVLKIKVDLKHSEISKEKIKEQPKSVAMVD